MSKNRKKNYDRVMSRVFNQSRSSILSGSNVTRHEATSSPSVNLGAKASVSNISSGVFSDLPTVLNDYIPESNRGNVKRSNVFRPRRTLKSQEVIALPPSTVTKSDKISDGPRKTCVDSAPSLMIREGETWSDTHVRQCHSSASHSRLRELKEEIKAYQTAEKMLKLRSKLYKQCGIVFDDFGEVAVDKAVQAEAEEPGMKISISRS